MTQAEKVQLDEEMVAATEHFRSIHGLSLFGILHQMVSNDQSDKTFYQYGQQTLKYFDFFDEKEDDEKFMKCLLGYYEIKKAS